MVERDKEKERERERDIKRKRERDREIKGQRQRVVERERESERERERERERKRERERERERERLSESLGCKGKGDRKVHMSKSIGKRSSNQFYQVRALCGVDDRNKPSNKNKSPSFIISIATETLLLCPPDIPFFSILPTTDKKYY